MGRRDCDGTKQSDIAIAFKPTASGKRVVIERRQKIGEVLLRPVDRQRTRPKQSSHRFPVFRNGLPENHSRGRHLRIFPNYKLCFEAIQRCNAVAVAAPVN